MPVASVGAVVHDASLGLVVADTDGNLLVLAFAPAEAATRLVPRADFRLGTVPQRILRARVAVPLGTPLSARRTFCALFGTHAGSVGALLPLEEGTFKCLLTLQRVLTLCLPHAAGLNPRVARAFASPATPSRTRARNLLDGTLLWRFLALSTHTQAALADAIGTTPARLVANLRAVDAAATVF